MSSSYSYVSGEGEGSVQYSEGSSQAPSAVSYSRPVSGINQNQMATVSTEQQAMSISESQLRANNGWDTHEDMTDSNEDGTYLTANNKNTNLRPPSVSKIVTKLEEEIKRRREVARSSMDSSVSQANSTEQNGEGVAEITPDSRTSTSESQPSSSTTESTIKPSSIVNSNTNTAAAPSPPPSAVSSSTPTSTPTSNFPNQQQQQQQPSRLSRNPYSKPQIVEDNGPPLFKKINGKWVETTQTKAFFESNADMGDEADRALKEIEEATLLAAAGSLGLMNGKHSQAQTQGDGFGQLNGNRGNSDSSNGRGKKVDEERSGGSGGSVLVAEDLKAAMKNLAKNLDAEIGAKANAVVTQQQKQKQISPQTTTAATSSSSPSSQSNTERNTSSSNPSSTLPPPLQTTAISPSGTTTSNSSNKSRTLQQLDQLLDFAIDLSKEVNDSNTPSANNSARPSTTQKSASTTTKTPNFNPTSSAPTQSGSPEAQNASGADSGSGNATGRRRNAKRQAGAWWFQNGQLTEAPDEVVLLDEASPTTQEKLWVSNLGVGLGSGDLDSTESLAMVTENTGFGQIEDGENDEDEGEEEKEGVVDVELKKSLDSLRIQNGWGEEIEALDRKTSVKCRPRSNLQSKSSLRNSKDVVGGDSEENADDDDDYDDEQHEIRYISNSHLAHLTQNMHYNSNSNSHLSSISHTSPTQHSQHASSIHSLNSPFKLNINLTMNNGGSREGSVKGSFERISAISNSNNDSEYATSLFDSPSHITTLYFSSQQHQHYGQNQHGSMLVSPSSNYGHSYDNESIASNSPLDSRFKTNTTSSGSPSAGTTGTGGGKLEPSDESNLTMSKLTGTMGSGGSLNQGSGAGSRKREGPGREVSVMKPFCKDFGGVLTYIMQPTDCSRKAGQNSNPAIQSFPIAT
jgi:hypothetical protein